MSRAACDRYVTVMDAGEGPHKNKRTRFSDGAASYLARVRMARDELRLAPSMQSMGMPWNFFHTNTGRRPMSLRAKYRPTEQQIRTKTHKDALARDEGAKFAHDLETYPLAVEAAEQGGSAIKTVVLAGGHEGNYEFLVVPGCWTGYRLAQYVAKHLIVRECAFCHVTQCNSRGLDDFLLVDSGGTMYVLPGCEGCRSSISKEVERLVEEGIPVRVDWIAGRSDGYLASVGYPDQRFW
ncbi:hypothetical protein AXK56_15810 [Tsukamurella pulmonis]|nr:hypothetical protein AXK56_15810 [Tsukamurella pulmonis]